MFARSSQVEPLRRFLAAGELKYSLAFQTSCSSMILLLWTWNDRSKKFSLHAVDPKEVLLKFFTQFFLLSQGSLNAQVALLNSLNWSRSLAWTKVAVACSFIHAMTPRFIGGGIKALLNKTQAASKQNSGSF